ncbi:MAG TPA: hypothetical protein PKZ12_00880 [Smithellaceae bacterium]|nr:hypothetical protein [Smithellaceae bacterium]
MLKSSARAALVLSSLFLIPFSLTAQEKTIPQNISGDRKIIVQMGHTSGVSRVLFSPAGKFLLSSQVGGTVKLWDVKTGRKKYFIPVLRIISMFLPSLPTKHLS